MLQLMVAVTTAFESVRKSGGKPRMCPLTSSSPETPQEKQWCVRLVTPVNKMKEILAELYTIYPQLYYELGPKIQQEMERESESKLVKNSLSV